jgi:hypothetical protein
MVAGFKLLSAVEGGFEERCKNWYLFTNTFLNKSIKSFTTPKFTTNLRIN